MLPAVTLYAIAVNREFVGRWDGEMAEQIVRWMSGNYQSHVLREAELLIACPEAVAGSMRGAQRSREQSVRATRVCSDRWQTETHRVF